MLIRSALFCTLALLTSTALGQTATPAPVPSPWSSPTVANGVLVPLIPQDASDCTNTTVRDDPNRIRGGEIQVVKVGANITVQVALTGSPNTTYHVFLKCVRGIGDVVTGDEGSGVGTFTIPNPGGVFAFDVYPDNPIAGNKFQSLTVKLP